MPHQNPLALALVSLGLFGAPAYAQSDDGELRSKMRQCARIADIPARVACYDAISSGEAEATAAPVAPPRPTRLGSEQLPSSRVPEADEDEAIEARVVASVEREPGVHLITLETGDQWLFLKGVSSSYTPPTTGSAVRIRSAPLGGYLLRYQGQPAVRVRRVR